MGVVGKYLPIRIWKMPLTIGFLYTDEKEIQKTSIQDTDRFVCIPAIVRHCRFCLLVFCLGITKSADVPFSFD